MIWRWFWREWRSPSLLIVWLALTLSVACVLALGSISDRMNKGLSQQSRDFIAGDRVLRTARPVPEDWLIEAQQQRLQVSRQLSFTTMTYAGDRPQLANVKATDLAYPLYGKLETHPLNLKPQPGTVLVAPRLLALLDSKVGDDLDVGDTTLRIAGEIIQEPDSGFNPFQTAPTIIINLADVDKTGAVQPGSRLTYRYMFAGSPKDIKRYEEGLKPRLKPDQRWYGLEESGSALGKSLQRSQQFLLLSALLTLLLSIAAVAVAMSHYCRSRYDLMAVLKTLGAGRKALSQLIIGQWLAVLLLAGICGSLIGLGFETLLLRLLAPVLPGALPAAGVWPWLWAVGALVMISLLVGLRPYRQLLATQPLRVLRRDVVANVWPLRYFLPATVVIVVLLLTLLMGASTLLWAILAGMVVLALLLAGIGWGSLLLLRRFTLKSLALRLAVNRLLHQPWVTISQLSAFSLSFMLLALLLVLRGDLLDRWQQQLPPGSPNYFLLNISTSQVPGVKAFLQKHQLREETFYPIVRVRLTEINQQQATKRVNESDPGGEAVNRELNLTWQAERPDHNPLTAGSWPPKSGEVSMDEGLAGRLKVTLGDTLTFSGDTQSFSAKVTSLRQVDWESLKPNFYFIFPPGALDGQPQTWLTSFRYEGDGKVLTQLNRQFPTLSLLDIGSILKQVGSVLQQVSKALEVMVVLVVICGGLLLMAQVQVGMRQRRQELVVYRTLGAGKRLLRGTLWCEFALLGLVAGIAATVGAEAALWLLQTKVFDFPWVPTPMLWWALPLLSALLLSLCGGWLGVRLLRGRALFRSYDG
ncbi:putative ABC transporter permease subunit YbbP [Serratia sp. UGAL515B_01]|uniref:putative ABC transporter permease subunit YbbP n=1 Tax=Serratia sp. UGAL515B_01 TaxID=2986763 RepID=UPI0029537596|nr:putative ABC transporter permease subunit YbbP [Serratia sp. UGAL515B_01]WON76133.1 ABC transporter permease [Serratia sp. UGAL515B_01]